jgi:hypothetical protein
MGATVASRVLVVAVDRAPGLAEAPAGVAVRAGVDTGLAVGEFRLGTSTADATAGTFTAGASAAEALQGPSPPVTRPPTP